MLMELKVAMVLLPLDAPRIRSCADLMHEFLSQYTFNSDIEVTMKELEATKQLTNETITAFILR